MTSRTPPRVPPPPPHRPRAALATSPVAAPVAKRFPPPQPFAPPPGRAAPAQAKASPGRTGSPPPVSPFRPALLRRKGGAVQKASSVATTTSTAEVKAAQGDPPKGAGPAPTVAPDVAVDEKTEMVGVDEYKAGTRMLRTTDLMNCVAIVAHDAARGRAAMTHYHTRHFLRPPDDDEEDEPEGADGKDDAPLSTKDVEHVERALTGVKARLDGMLPGAGSITYHVGLGASWRPDSELWKRYGATLSRQLASLFRVDIGARPVLSQTASFDPVTGRLTR